MGPGPHPPALTGATPAEAAQLIVSAVRPLPAELRTLRDALDLVTTDDIASPIDLPPWTNSAMDGFACRSADVHAGVVLRVVETIATEMAWIRVTPRGLVLEEIAPGLSVDDVQRATEPRLSITEALKEMRC